jgi:S-(hydroxymethyl)glutathione dehydrogenase/alcohol dehydrogenase
VVGLAPVNDLAGIDAVALVRQEKTLKGTYYGSARPTVDIHAIVDLYRSGKINVDDLIARHYKLEDINDAFNDLDRGEVGRGVITQF